MIILLWNAEKEKYGDIIISLYNVLPIPVCIRQLKIEK